MTVSAGATVCEPLADTVPILGLIETDVAPVTFHDNVADCPAVIVPGLMLKLFIAGRLGAVTMMVADAREEPERLLAVSA